MSSEPGLSRTKTIPDSPELTVSSSTTVPTLLESVSEQKHMPNPGEVLRKNLDYLLTNTSRLNLVILPTLGRLRFPTGTINCTGS